MKIIVLKKNQKNSVLLGKAFLNADKKLL